MHFPGTGNRVSRIETLIRLVEGSWKHPENELWNGFGCVHTNYQLTSQSQGSLTPWLRKYDGRDLSRACVRANYIAWSVDFAHAA